MQLIPFRKSKWIVQKTKGGRFDCLKVGVSGKRIEILDRVTCEGVSALPASRMEAVIHSERMVISSESFPPVKADLLTRQIDERLRPTGPWDENTSLHHCVHLQERRPGMNSYVVVTLPRNDIDKILSPLAQADVRVDRCIPHVAAVAALIGRMSDEPVMACILDGSYLEIVVGEKGIPLYSQISPIDDEMPDFDLIGQAIFNARQIFDSRFSKSVKKTVVFCTKDVDIPDRFGHEEIWRPELDFVTGRYRDAVWRFPYLAGAPIASSEFDCLPKQLRSSYIIQDMNKAAACFALAGLILTGISGLRLSDEYREIRTSLSRLASTVDARRTQLVEKMPGESEVRIVSQITKVMKAVGREPSLDEILYSVAVSLPEHVSIENMEIERSAPEPATTAATEIPVPAPSPAVGENGGERGDEMEFFGRPLVMTLEFVTTGNFQQVKTRLERTADLLGNRFRLKDIKMEYKEETGQGKLACRIEIEQESA